MRDARSPEEDQPQPGAAQVSRDIQQQAQDARATARETRAQMHTILSRTRQFLQETEETVQHTKARREYEAEQGIRPPAPVPRAGVDILLIEENPADVALFRYVLHECALSCRFTVLSRRRDVEAFFAQAATTASLSLPRLIIADCLIPGMEAEEIMTAVRTVPAYRRVPVVLFSTLPEEEGRRRSVQCGATTFVNKPGELRAFVEAASTMVRQWGGVGEGLDPALTQEERRAEKGDSSKTTLDEGQR